MFILSNEPWEFVPESQKDVENPITFILVPPTREVALKGQHILQKALAKSNAIQFIGTEDSQEQINAALMTAIDEQTEYNELLMSKCIIGWKNVVDAKGNAVAFSKDSFALFNDLAILAEVTTEIQRGKSADPKN